MLDRVPVNPGRVLIAPENGSAAYYATMARADNPTQEGTPLNKASLLKDATAAKFGLGTDAVPDDVFGVLSRFQSGLGNEYVWAKYSNTQVSKIVESTTGEQVAMYVREGATTFTVQYADTVEMSGDSVVLVNPTTITGSISDYASSYAAQTVGKYVVSAENGKVYKIAGAATEFYGNYIGQAGYLVSVEYETVSTLVGYVNSPDTNAYPIDDGFTYAALGQLGANMTKIATGSYKGTGLVGPSNPCVVNLDFAPKFGLVFMGVFPEKGSYGWKAGGFAWAAPIAKDRIDYSTNADLYKLHFTVTEGTFKFNLGGEQGNYANTLGGGAADYQCNTSGKTYNYIFVG